MLVAVGIIAILGITGPVAKERAQRNDKLIEVNATKVTKAIADYNKNNGKLPDSLNDINLEGDAKKLVTDKLVTYKKETTTSTATPTPKATTSKSSSSSSSNLSDDYYNSYSSLLSASQAKYQLCATFVNKSEGFTKDDSQSSDNYSSYINATQHPSGEVCYKMYASSY